jgi:hypothetical protein
VKANRGPRARRQARDDAVSSVVAGILVFALFTTVFTMWTVTTLPEWIADREQSHARGVQDAFATLSSGLDALSAASDKGPSAVPVKLGPEPVALLQPVAANGELGVQDTVRAQATFTGESLRFAGSVAVGEPDEDIDEGVGDVLSDVEFLQALVIRLSTDNVGNADEAWVSVVATDGTSTITALITHAGKPNGAGPNEAGCLNSELRLEVTSDFPPSGPVTSIQALLCELAEDLSGYSLDLTSNFYPFVDAVERLETPYTLTLTDDAAGGSASATGSYAAAYLDSSDRDQGAGSGEAVDYTLDQLGTRLAYLPAYQSYANQDVSWELGGVVVAQDDGMAVVSVPAFSLSVDGGVGSLRWTLVELRGDGAQSGRGQATVRVEHDQTTDLVLTADGALFTLTTPGAAAWRSFLANQVLLADAATDAAVGGTGNTATLSLSSTSVSEWTFHLRLVKATVVVQ